MTASISIPAGQQPLAAGIREQFITAMGAAATGVTVVATDGPSGRYAQTVSAMCSVSADPALVLVCINQRSPINEALAAHGVFSVNLLGKKHDHVADTFAGRPWPGKEPWDFSCGEWDDAPSGAPRVRDAVASFDCEVHGVSTAGTHYIYIGRVTDVQAEPGVPLVYSAHSYAEPVPFPPSVFPDYPGSGPVHRNNTKENSR